jgi:hypothetical protein
MRTRMIQGLVLAATLAFAGAAHAQEGLSTKPDYDLIYTADRVDDNARQDLSTLQQRALAAMQAKDFAGAEVALAEVLQRSAKAPGANFLMGLAKIGLEKWSEARPYLEAAIVDEPKRPEPKTRLGITYVKLGNPDAAKVQREALVALGASCKNACQDATWIAEGIALIDQAMSSEQAAARISAAALAAVTAPAYDSSKGFEPEKYNLITFSDTNDLYDLLTAEGRCPPNKTADPRQPCALILYRPLEGALDARAANFKPVFKIVNSKTIWAIHDKKLQKVRIEDLFFDEVDIIGKERARYQSIAVIGNAENKANCAKGVTCLAQLVTQDMFNMYTNMPPSVVEVIWGTGMKDSGTIRIR